MAEQEFPCIEWSLDVFGRFFKTLDDDKRKEVIENIKLNIPQVPEKKCLLGKTLFIRKFCEKGGIGISWAYIQ